MGVSISHPVAGKSVPLERVNSTSSRLSFTSSSVIARLNIALSSPARNVGEVFVETTETSSPYIAASFKAKSTEKSVGVSAVKLSITGKIPASSRTSPDEAVESKETRFWGSNFKSWSRGPNSQVLPEPEPSTTFSRRKGTIAGDLDDLAALTIVTSNS